MHSWIRLPVSTAEIEAELVRRSLPLFVEATWETALPGTRYLRGWHIDEICGLLEAVSRFEETRLLITAPPRHTKSALVSIFFPAWVWLTQPEMRFICVSNGQALADEHSLACRRLIESDVYKQLNRGRFQLARDQNRKNHFRNTRGGSRQATSFGGPLTGFGADIVVVDDAHRAADAHNPAALEKTNRLFFQTLSTRLNNPQRSAIVVAAQRLARDDLPGELARSGIYTRACFHAAYDPAHPYPYPRDPRTQPGEPLFPALWNRAALDQLVLSPQDWAAQYQQAPEASGDRTFRVERLGYYPPSDLPPDFDDVVQAWDPSFGASSPKSSYAAGQLWAMRGGKFYLLRQIRRRMSFQETIEAIYEMDRWAETNIVGHRGHRILIERAANGSAIIDTLEVQDRLRGRVEPLSPDGGKERRAIAASIHVDDGKVFLPGVPNHDGTSYDPTLTPTDTQELVAELARCPNGAFDDQIDAMSYALIDLAIRAVGPGVWNLN